MGVEAEALDADLQRGTAALEEMLEEQFQTEGTLDTRVDFADLAVSQFLPARADRGIVAQAVEEQLDLVESEAHFTGEADQEQAVKGVAGIAALAAGALRKCSKDVQEAKEKMEFLMEMAAATTAE